MFGDDEIGAKSRTRVCENQFRIHYKFVNLDAAIPAGILQFPFYNLGLEWATIFHRSFFTSTYCATRYKTRKLNWNPLERICIRKKPANEQKKRQSANRDAVNAHFCPDNSGFPFAGILSAITSNLVVVNKVVVKVESTSKRFNTKVIYRAAIRASHFSFVESVMLLFFVYRAMCVFIEKFPDDWSIQSHSGEFNFVCKVNKLHFLGRQGSQLRRNRIHSGPRANSRFRQYWPKVRQWWKLPSMVDQRNYLRVHRTVPVFYWSLQRLLRPRGDSDPRPCLKKLYFRTRIQLPPTFHCVLSSIRSFYSNLIELFTRK